MQAKVRKKQGSGEKFLRWELFIYRARGVVQENLLDMTFASFPGDACPLRRSEGDLFLPEFKSFRGIGLSESTRFPEGLVLGNSGKTLHPRNVGFAEIHEISFQVMCKNDSRIWLLRVNLLSILGWLKLAKLWDHEPAKP
jgi:hypothetical protein